MSQELVAIEKKAKSINQTERFIYYCIVTTIMGYDTSRAQGRLTEVLQPTLVERLSEPDLVFPEQVFSTRVTIQGDAGPVSTEILGIVPTNYLNKEVELVQSSCKLPHQKLFRDELYVEGKCVVNQVVIKTE